MKRPFKITAFGAALVVLTVGAAPLLSSAADHIDASAFGSLSQDGGATFNAVSVNGERDINDVYAFQGKDAHNTVLAMTTNPAINAFGGKFGANVRYILNVDKNGDAVQDLAYVVRFDNGKSGHQKYTVTRYTGANAVSLGHGMVIARGSTAGNGQADIMGPGHGRVFAGVRSDPFFFDLTGLRRIGLPRRQRPPREQTRATSSRGSTPTRSCSRSPITTSARTHRRLGPDDLVERQHLDARRPDGPPGDQHGVQQQARRSGNSGATKNAVQRHASVPAADSRWRPVPGQHHHHADEHQRGARASATPTTTQAQAEGLADFLLPDVLTYDTSTKADGTAFNGRALADDVIDAELGVTTNGSVTSDGVAAHTDYRKDFPYLGNPHH